MQEEADAGNAEIKIRSKIKSDLEDLYRKRSSILCQKARVNWSLKGEKNTKYFHRAIARRRKANLILGLLSQGVWHSKPKDIKRLCLDHFIEVLKSKVSDQIFKLPLDSLNKLGEEDSAKLIRDFTLEEIEED